MRGRHCSSWMEELGIVPRVSSGMWTDVGVGEGYKGDWGEGGLVGEAPFRPSPYHFSSHIGLGGPICGGTAVYGVRRPREGSGRAESREGKPVKGLLVDRMW